MGILYNLYVWLPAEIVNFVSDRYSVRFGRDLAAVVVVIYTFDFSLHLFKAKMNRMPRKVEEMKERVSFYIGKR